MLEEAKENENKEVRKLHSPVAEHSMYPPRSSHLKEKEVYIYIYVSICDIALARVDLFYFCKLEECSPRTNP